jgi:hypothetical protein
VVQQDIACKQKKDKESADLTVSETVKTEGNSGPTGITVCMFNLTIVNRTRTEPGRFQRLT